MMPLAPITNLFLCFDSIEDLASELDDSLWATQSYCPDWDVRAVLAHLAAVEAMLTGKAPGSLAKAVPFDQIGDYLDRVAELDNEAFLASYLETISARRQELVGYTADQMDLRSMTPVGPGTYGRFMRIRVFDFWVHEQDIRGPLAMAGHESGPAAETAIDEIEGSIGYVVGKKIGLSDGQSISFQLSGPVERQIHVVVDGRAVQVDELKSPTLTIRTDSTTFALLACGRIDPQIPIDQGQISWSGNSVLADHAARNLRFTM